MEVLALKKLLGAFYGELYKLESVAELKCMTQLADYYCALPTLSRSIQLPLFRGDIDVEDDLFALIEIAAKLHHADLFRECVIYIAGYWTDPVSLDSSKVDSRIKKMLQNARNRVGALVAKVHKEVCLRKETIVFPLLK